MHKISLFRWPKRQWEFRFTELKDMGFGFETVSVNNGIELKSGDKTDSVCIKLDGGKTISFPSGILPEGLDTFPAKGEISFDKLGNIAKVVAA